MDKPSAITLGAFGQLSIIMAVVLGWLPRLSSGLSILYFLFATSEFILLSFCLWYFVFKMPKEY